MNGADLLCDTLLANDVDTCFANPGTSEMHFVAALDRKPQMRCVLGLFEGVVSGAADGYARMAKKPAATLLHLGPGLGNALANLHNAKRARTPMVNVVGDHARHHLQYDAPLTSDIESIARPMSHWVRRIGSPEAVGEDAGEAIAQAMRQPGQISTLILPADCAWTDLPEGTQARKIAPLAAALTDAGHVKDVARHIAAARKAGKRVVLFLGPQAVEGEAAQVAGRIAQATGVQLMTPTAFRRVGRGRGAVDIARLPYPVDQGVKTLADCNELILVGTNAPVAFFAYPGKASEIAPPGCEVRRLSRNDEDALHALQALAEALNVPASGPATGAAPAIDLDAPTSGKLTSAAVNRLTLRALPEGAIVVDESVTSGREIAQLNMGAAPHDWLAITGGAIGQGIPTAVGAGVACPTRQVVSFQADGSGMYTCQGLWTQAREKLKVLTIVYANETYAILHGEMQAVGTQEPGVNARRMLDLDQPAVNWAELAGAMGVPSRRVDTVEAFADALKAGLAENGPFLIEARI
jgi:acetolactate synthase-1/2/3 large subunit